VLVVLLLLVVLLRSGVLLNAETGELSVLALLLPPGEVVVSASCFQKKKKSWKKRVKRTC
jgi:hypothetical protein